MTNAMRINPCDRTDLSFGVCSKTLKIQGKNGPAAIDSWGNGVNYILLVLVESILGTVIRSVKERMGGNRCRSCQLSQWTDQRWPESKQKKGKKCIGTEGLLVGYQ